MRDDLFTDEPPTDIGWYWVRTAGGALTLGRVQEDGRFYIQHDELGKSKYGPRIPTPEQCAVLEKE
jgi:hypothetical protein